MPEQDIKHRYTDVEYIQVHKFTISYKDVFSMKYLYNLLREWLVDNNYASDDTSKFGEVFYLQRDNPKDGREIWARWRLKKEPEKASKLWRYDLDIDIHVTGLREVEIPIGNKKIRADQGEVEINVAANLIIDYEKAWEKHPWLKNFKNWIIYKYLKSKLDSKTAELFEDASRLQEAIKTYLQIQTYLPKKEFGEFYEKRLPEE
ncbi:hypothetical protein HYV79_00880 [Candidatus Woesearchaeota archaeon]|nr:hypothetical protein [Candidatus Woesearchaeota archaeon]